MPGKNMVVGGHMVIIFSPDPNVLFQRTFFPCFRCAGHSVAGTSGCGLGLSPPGVAFVTYECYAEATLAIGALQGGRIGGEAVSVRLADQTAHAARGAFGNESSR